MENNLSPGSVTVDMGNVHGRIEYARKARGLTYEALETVMGRSKGYVSRFLSKERSPKLESVREFAKALSVSLDWLVNGEGPMDATAPTTGQTYAMLDGWQEAVAEVLRRPKWKDLAYAINAAGARGILVQPEQLTPEFVVDVARFWLDHAPEAERAHAEAEEASRLKKRREGDGT